MLDKLFCLYSSSALHRGVSGVLRSNLPPVVRDTLHPVPSIQKAGPKILNGNRSNIRTNYMEIVPVWVEVQGVG